jgi:predicted nucleic acid-binding protein
MAWCFGDQADAYTYAALDALRDGEAAVPPIWFLEVSNSLVVGERRKKLSGADSAQFLVFLASLPIRVEPDIPQRAFGPILLLARQLRLSCYDAAYLELAMREKLPLATGDGALKKAAAGVGLPTWTAP